MEEIEVKFHVGETGPVAETLRGLGFKVTVERHREHNFLLDDGAGTLQKSGQVLRVRQTPARHTVTFKGPIQAASRVKRREEIECSVESADTVLRILEQTGFQVWMEYEKYRTVFEKDSFHIALDETKAGNYLEIEGPSDQAIMELAEKLGYSEQDSVRRTYAELIGESRAG
jgi:predicted adenylyl cyclase CyaB